tara:strand:+ start:560 stop:739 length:180 start_codon:yes stop_codon:yes gene_type:complete
MPKRRIKKNDLTAWFLQDHATLPASYVKSCQKFFKELQAASSKRQAASNKPVDKLINKG